MMKAKNIYILGISLFCIATAVAQDPLQRQVDVTRAYEPSVQNALKLNIAPDMTDTVQTRPDHQYLITPRPLNYGFDVGPLTAARFTAADESARLPFYAKIGAGGPLQSMADIRYSQSSDRLKYGAFFTHTGRYGKIANDMEIKESRFGTDNRIGGFVDFRPGLGPQTDFSIGAEAGYRFRNVTRYGYYYPAAKKPAWILTGDEYMKQLFHNPYVRISAGSDFRGPQRVHARIGGGVNYFADRFQYNQLRWEVDGLLGFRINNGGLLTFGPDVRTTRGQKNRQGYENTIIQLEAAYTFEKNGVRFHLGAGFGSSAITLHEGGDSTRNAFLPQISVEKTLHDGRLIPFLEVCSKIEDNSYGELAGRNPYLYSGQSAPNTIRYDARIGIRGTLAEMLKYTVYGGYAMRKDAVLWANAYSGYPSAANGASQPFYGQGGNVFTVLTDDLNGFEAGLDLRANLFNALVWQAGLNVRHWSSDTQAEAWGLPGMEAHTGLTYNHRDRLCLKADLEYTGKRQMYSLLSGGTSNELPGQTNLTFGVDYFLHKQIGAFLQLDNLLNQRLYHFNYYREPGLNVLIGVKLSF
jgi:hypothetical protein